jgi:hypothetical protein
MRVVMVPGPCQPTPKERKDVLLSSQMKVTRGRGCYPATLPPASVTSTLKLNKVWEEVSVDPGSPGLDTAGPP